MIIFLSILAGLLVLLSIRVALLVEWSDQMDVWVCWLFLRFQLKNPEKSDDKPAKDTKKKDAKAEQKKEKKAGEPRALEDTIAILLDLVSSATGPLLMLLHNLRIGFVELHMTVVADDAAETAIRCGQMNAYLYGAYATLKSIVRIKRIKLNVEPDFLADKGGFSLRLQASITPLVVLGAALRFGVEFLWNTVKNSAQTQAAPPNPADAEKPAVSAGKAPARK